MAEISPRRVFLVNFLLSSKAYLSANYPSIISLIVLVSMPKIYKGIIKARYSIRRNIRSGEELQELL